MNRFVENEYKEHASAIKKINFGNPKNIKTGKLTIRQ